MADKAKQQNEEPFDARVEANKRVPDPMTDVNPQVIEAIDPTVKKKPNLLPPDKEREPSPGAEREG